jgi:hypothetical protein
MQGGQNTKLLKTQWPNEEMSKRAFPKEEIQVAKNHIKKCSPSLNLKENANQNQVKIPPHSC